MNRKHSFKPSAFECFLFHCLFIMLIVQSLANMLKKSASDRKFFEFTLTPTVKSGLIRLVARIAQSVEQGIENPRVLGSIPSPGTTFSSTVVSSSQVNSFIFNQLPYTITYCISANSTLKSVPVDEFFRFILFKII